MLLNEKCLNYDHVNNNKHYVNLRPNNSLTKFSCKLLFKQCSFSLYSTINYAYDRILIITNDINLLAIDGAGNYINLKTIIFFLM